MVPFDVTAAKLAALLEALDRDTDFLGAAIAVPHKEAVARWLGERVTPEAARIGAVNCLFRRDGRLWGTNTDGEAARVSLERRVGGLLSEKRVLLLGPGGAGKAVAAFIVGGCRALFLVGRDAERTRAFADRIGASSISVSALDAQLPAVDVLVNCTSVGSAAAGTAELSPLSPAQIARLPDHALVFDIIYDPSPTRLLALAAARGLATLDGTEMNLEQAALAFGHAVPGTGTASDIHAAMAAAARRA